MLTWYRSWPAIGELQADADDDGPRPHVVDRLPRLLMRGYDYRTVSDWPTDTPGICLLEWDVALDQVSRYRFASFALAEPYRVSVAAYQLGDGWLPRGCGAGPRCEEEPPCGLDDPTPRGLPNCYTFGFGCIYLPRRRVEEFLALSIDFTDSGFSRWYHANHGGARVCWDVQPQHLHEWPDV